MSKLRPADAHDAGFLVVLCPKYAQLMLMMWLFGGVVSKVRPADAHDAGCLGVLCPKYAADAHDAGCLVVLYPKYIYLLLMMLAVWVFFSVRPADAHDAGC